MYLIFAPLRPPPPKPFDYYIDKEVDLRYFLVYTRIEKTRKIYT